MSGVENDGHEAFTALAHAVYTRDQAAAVAAIDRWYDESSWSDPTLALMAAITYATAAHFKAAGGRLAELEMVNQRGEHVNPEQVAHEPELRGAALALRAVIAVDAGGSPYDHLELVRPEEECHVFAMLYEAWHRAMHASAGMPS